MIKEVKSSVLWTYVVEDLNAEEIVVTFYEKEFQEANHEEVSRIDKNEIVI